MLTFLKHTYCLIGQQIELLNASRRRPLYRVVKRRRSSSITTWRLPSNRWWRTSRVIIVSTVSKSPCGGHKFINWNTSLIEIHMCNDVVKCQFCLRKYYISIIPPTNKIMCTISGKNLCTNYHSLYNKHDFKLQATHRRRPPPTQRAPAPSTATSTRRVRTLPS